MFLYNKPYLMPMHVAKKFIILQIKILLLTLQNYM